MASDENPVSLDIPTQAEDPEPGRFQDRPDGVGVYFVPLPAYKHPYLWDQKCYLLEHLRGSTPGVAGAPGTRTVGDWIGGWASSDGATLDPLQEEFHGAGTASAATWAQLRPTRSTRGKERTPKAEACGSQGLLGPQSYAPVALRLFQQLFSGNIVPSEAVGARRLEPERAGAHRLIRAHCENLKWTLRGEPGRRAASALAAQAVLKQPQLLLAAHYPSSLRRPRAALQNCKWMGPFSRAKAAGITWPYVAGLFDAVGHIRPNRPKLVFLEFSQKSYRFLEILETFLKAQLSLDSLSEFVSVRHFHRLSRLSVVDSSIAQTMLRQLLRVGLSLRKELRLILTAQRCFVDDCGFGRLLPAKRRGRCSPCHAAAPPGLRKIRDEGHCNSETWSLSTVRPLRPWEKAMPPPCRQTGIRRPPLRPLQSGSGEEASEMRRRFWRSWQSDGRAPMAMRVAKACQRSGESRRQEVQVFQSLRRRYSKDIAVTPLPAQLCYLPRKHLKWT
eukprot:s5296_g5.t4